MAGNRVCRLSSFSNILLHFKPPLSAAAPPPPFLNYKRYSCSSEERDGHEHVEDERAPSTAQEFVRVAEERQQLRHHHHQQEEEEEEGQPAASQTVVKKVYEGPEEAVSGNKEHDENTPPHH